MFCFIFSVLLGVASASCDNLNLRFCASAMACAVIDPNGHSFPHCKGLERYQDCCRRGEPIQPAKKEHLALQRAIAEPDQDADKIESSVMARIKIGLYGGFLGISSIGTGIILLKYLYARARVHMDDNNFSTMRRVSRARSCTVENGQFEHLNQIHQQALVSRRQTLIRI